VASSRPHLQRRRARSRQPIPRLARACGLVLAFSPAAAVAPSAADAACECSAPVNLTGIYEQYCGGTGGFPVAPCDPSVGSARGSSTPNRLIIRQTEYVPYDVEADRFPRSKIRGIFVWETEQVTWEGGWDSVFFRCLAPRESRPRAVAYEFETEIAWSCACSLPYRPIVSAPLEFDASLATTPVLVASKTIRLEGTAKPGVQEINLKTLQAASCSGVPADDCQAFGPAWSDDCTRSNCEDKCIDGNESVFLESDRRNYVLTGPAPPSEDAGTITGFATTLENQPAHGSEVFDGTVILSVQDSFIRGKRPTESDEAYAEYVDTVPRRAVAEYTLNPNLPGFFQFDNVPVFERNDRGTLVFLEYSVEVRGASAVQYLLDENGDRIPDGSGGEKSIPLEFFDETVFNVRPSEPSDTPFDVEVLMSPIGELAIKLDLVDKLQRVAENAYEPIETEVATYLEGFSDGSIPFEGAPFEGLKRAVWAERAVFFGTDVARQLLDVMGESASSMAGDVYDFFDVWRQKDLKKARAEYEELAERKDALAEVVERYPSAGVTPQAVVIQKALAKIQEGQQFAAIQTSKIADFLTGLTKSSVKYLDSALGGLGADDEAIALSKKALLAVWKTVLDVLRFQSVGSVARTGLKILIEDSTKLVISEGLYDPPSPVASALPAFCPDRLPALTNSRDKMMTWAADDPDLYRIDRDIGIDILKPALTSSTAALARAGEFLAYAQASDALSEVSDLIGNVYAVAKWAKILFEVGKWGFNIAAFAEPSYQLYGVLDDAIDESAYFLYGDNPPSEFTRAVATAPTARAAANPTLLADVQQAAADLEAAVAEITAAVGEDRIFDALLMVAGEAEPTLVGRIETFTRSADRFLAQSAAIDTIPWQSNAVYVDLTLTMGEMMAHRFATVSALRDLYLAVLLEDYAGPDDSRYQAHRGVMVNDLGAMGDVAARFASLAGQFASETSARMFTPVILIDTLTAVSQSTGERYITESPETFQVSARIKNISSESVSGLTARMTVATLNASASLLGAADQAISNGTLAPDDGVEDDGDDEVLLTWNVEYAGDLQESDPIALTVELLESGDAPASFVGEPRYLAVVRALELIDADADGIPDHYERANGLDPTMDDSSSDLDEDGVDNGTEYELGTSVGDSDSDGDGLSDGEELAPGADGYVTDPLAADTDADGVEDPSDGDPIDGSTTDPTPAPGEPVVALAETFVALDPDVPVASVSVTNAGDGVLQWTAQSDAPLVLAVTPEAPDFAVDAGAVTIALREGIDASVLESIDATVSVIDIVGGVGDAQTIHVIVGSDLDPLFCGHATDGSLGGTVTATDALLALKAAVGTATCNPCRCDVDDSGSLSASDALRILQAAVGLDSALTCPRCVASG
jgi:hypothetical protein